MRPEFFSAAMTASIFVLLAFSASSTSIFSVVTPTVKLTWSAGLYSVAVPLTLICGRSLMAVAEHGRVITREAAAMRRALFCMRFPSLFAVFSYDKD